MFRHVSLADLLKMAAVEIPMTEKPIQNVLKCCFSNFAVHIEHILPVKIEALSQQSVGGA